MVIGLRTWLDGRVRLRVFTRSLPVSQVKCDHTSLNQGDVFILDCGLMIYVWNGPQSSKMERIKVRASGHVTSPTTAATLLHQW